MTGENVVEFDKVKPKRSRKRHRQHEIVIVYDPETKRWVWSFKHTYTIKLTEDAKTEKRAYEDACKRLDEILDADP